MSREEAARGFDVKHPCKCKSATTGTESPIPVWTRDDADWRAPLREIVADATRFVESERSDRWGRPLTNHKRIAALWSVYLEREVTASEAAAMMVLLKMARLMESPDSRDSVCDLIGYAMAYADCRDGGLHD